MTNIRSTSVSHHTQVIWDELPPVCSLLALTVARPLGSLHATASLTILAGFSLWYQSDAILSRLDPTH